MLRNLHIKNLALIREIDVDFAEGLNILTGETVVTITDEQSVRTMVWALFSLFPAAIACIMAFLAYKFPLKK